jgi:hypothetical protein
MANGPRFQRFRFSRKQLFVRAGDGPRGRPCGGKSFISQDNVSPALSPLGARSPKVRLRARPEKDDKLEVKDEELDRKGGDEPYD